MFGFLLRLIEFEWFLPCPVEGILAGDCLSSDWWLSMRTPTGGLVIFISVVLLGLRSNFSVMATVGSITSRTFVHC